MPKLKIIMDSLDDLDEALKGLYVEKGDKFVLDLSDEDVRSHPAVKGLKSALDKEKADRKKDRDKVAELEAKLATFPEDFDADELAELKALKQKLSDDDNDDKKGKDGDKHKVQKLTELHAQALKNLEKKKDGEVARMRERAERAEAHLKRVLIDQGLTKEYIAAGVKPEFVEFVLAKHRSDAVVDVEGDEPIAMIKTDAGDIPVAEFVANWAAGDSAKAFIAQPKGGDSNGSGGTTRKQSSGPNPWKKESWNLTQQGQILRSDRARAEKLAKEAGVPLIPGGQVPSAA